MVNTANNKRRRDSRRRIEAALVQQLQDKELQQISVSDICKDAGVNRTTFYANYEDIYALAEAVKQRIEQEVLSLYQAEQTEKIINHDFLKLFQHIYANQLVYNTYFKLNTGGYLTNIGYSTAEAELYYDNQLIDYHLAFFGYGITAVIRKWLRGGCKETPEQINSVIVSEYHKMLPVK
ncbi:MAG: TetR/AcrR family transcriptional regulator [Firmicutes bacterium]|nr:TetR/AcrR family transcriptional regulator [Bacillota bacterium]